MQKIIKTSIIWIIFMLGCCGCQKKEQPIQELEEIGSEKSETSKQEETKEKKTIYVYVCGAVMQAGVYELQQDSRVYEAIQKAGGFAENADISEINQAALLQDEEQSGKVNLNTATKEELMTLAGIGESKADSIIKYREEHGKFQSIEDIKQIEGIKDGVFQKIKDLITV